ncbi:MAG: class I lanthipeptide [Bacteroidia bacterium]|nr:class I lanthipeptide [Bacteroidia bacterium]
MYKPRNNMKPKKIKLQLNKETIVELNNVEMSAIEGGLMWTTSFGHCQSSCCPPPTGYTLGHPLCCTSEDTDSCMPRNGRYVLAGERDTFRGEIIPTDFMPRFDDRTNPVIDGTAG